MSQHLVFVRKDRESVSRAAILVALLVALVVTVWFVAFPEATHAYQFSSQSASACPECTTSTGQTQAADIANTLSLDGPPSSAFGSTSDLTAAVEAAGTDVAEGAADTAANLLPSGALETAIEDSPAGNLALAADAFATGFLIGTEGRALYLKIFGGHAEVTSGDLAPHDSVWLRCKPSEGCILNPFVPDPETPPAQPGQYYLGQSIGSSYTWNRTSWTASTSLTNCYGGPPSSCETTAHDGAGGYSSVSHSTAVERNRCGISGCVLYPGDEQYIITPTKTITFVRDYKDFIEDHDTRVTTFTGNAPAPAWGHVTAPTQPRTQNQTLEGLDDAISQHPDYGAFVAAAIASASAPQPGGDGDGDDEDECQPSGETPQGDPAPLRGSGDYLQNQPQWFDRYDTVPASAFDGPGAVFPAAGVPAEGGQAYMRWGWTALDAQNPDADWQGWGYRHIAAKHGWGPQALAKTEDALTAGIAVPADRYTNYVGPAYQANVANRFCRWIVVVQRTPTNESNNPEADQDVPMGNITAFGKLIPNA